MDIDHQNTKSKRPTSWTAIKVVVAFAVVSCLVGAAIGVLFLNIPKFYSLVRNGRETTGTVTTKERENHMGIRVEYDVGGQRLLTGGRAEDIGRTFESIEIGEKVPVVYDSSDPSSSTLGNPRRSLNSSLQGSVFMTLATLLFLILYAVKKYVRLGIS